MFTGRSVFWYMGRRLLEMIRCFKCRVVLCPPICSPLKHYFCFLVVLPFASISLFLPRFFAFFSFSPFCSAQQRAVPPPSYFSSLSLCTTASGLPKECLWRHVNHQPALELALPGGWWRWFTPQRHRFRLSANSETSPCHKYPLPTAGHGPTGCGVEKPNESLQPTEPSLYDLFWVQLMGQTSS